MKFNGPGMLTRLNLPKPRISQIPVTNLAKKEHYIRSNSVLVVLINSYAISKTENAEDRWEIKKEERR